MLIYEHAPGSIEQNVTYATPNGSIMGCSSIFKDYREISISQILCKILDLCLLIFLNT